MLNEVRVGFREVFVPEKAVVRRKGRGVRALKNKVFCTVDVRTFLFRIISPQYEDEMLALIIQLFYRRIGKSLPTFSLVRARTTSVDCKSRIQKKYALLRPAREVGVVADFAAEVGFELFENILE